MFKQIMIGLFRHALTYGGGILVTKGLASQSDISVGISALITLVGIVWSILHKVNNEAAPVGAQQNFLGKALPVNSAGLVAPVIIAALLFGASAAHAQSTNGTDNATNVVAQLNTNTAAANIYGLLEKAGAPVSAIGGYAVIVDSFSKLRTTSKGKDLATVEYGSVIGGEAVIFNHAFANTNSLAAGMLLADLNQGARGPDRVITGIGVSGIGLTVPAWLNNPASWSPIIAAFFPNFHALDWEIAGVSRTDKLTVGVQGDLNVPF